MTAATKADARALLGAFLGDDEHYLASAAVYGDGGPEALDRALDLFLERPELGFVWLAWAGDVAVGACVVCRAISTSRGGVQTFSQAPTVAGSDAFRFFSPPVTIRR